MGGSVRVLDPQGNLLELDPDTGEYQSPSAEITGGIPTCRDSPIERGGDEKSFCYPQMEDAPVGAKAKGQAIHEDLGETIPHVHIESWHVYNTPLWDECEYHKVKNLAVVTGVNDSFVSVCKKRRIPFEFHNYYRKWLLCIHKSPEGSLMGANDLPLGRKKLRPGLNLNKPYGSK